MFKVVDNSDIKAAFTLFDFDKDGIVDIEDTIECLKKLEYQKKSPEIFELVSSIGTGRYNYEDFERKITILLSDATDEVGLRRVFDLFKNNEKEKVITLDSLKRICKDFGEILMDKDAEFIISEAGDGDQITFELFCKFMKKKYLDD